MKISIPICLTVLASIFLLAGCETPGSAQAKFQARQEEERQSIPPMEASDTFFGGQLIATLTLSSGLPPSIQHSSRAPGGKPGADPKFAPAVGANNGVSTYGGASNSPLDSYRPDEQIVGPWNGMTENTVQVEPTREELEAMVALRAQSPLPPVLLRLFLKNTSAAPITVEFIDFNSQLGNFALQPGKLTIDPGQIAYPNNVISRLGLTSYEIPVTVTLRIGDRKETKILKLHLKPGQP